MNSSIQEQADTPDEEPTPQPFLQVPNKREITLRAAETGETIRVIVLRALSA